MLTKPLEVALDNQTLRPKYISDHIQDYTLVKTPLLDIALRNKETTTQNPFYWSNIDISANTTTAASSHAAGVTTIDVTDASIFRKKDVIENQNTGERMKVTDVDATAVPNTLDVDRNLAGGTLTITAGDVLLKIGMAKEEGSTVVEVRSQAPTELYNYCQIYEAAWGETKSMNAYTPAIGNRPEDMYRRANMIFFRELEMNALKSIRTKDSTTYDYTQYLSGGFEHYVTTNITANGGTTITEVNFNTFLIEKGFYRPPAGGSDFKIGLAGDGIFKALAKWARGYASVDLTINQLGVYVTQYKTDTGNVLYLYNHPLFKNNAALTQTLYVIDPNDFAMMVAPGRDIQIQENIQNPKDDSIINRFLCECGWMVGNELNHAILTGVTGGA